MIIILGNPLIINVPVHPKTVITILEIANLIKNQWCHLIGQMGDPFYHRKINGLFHEFVETGMAQKLGYKTAMDLVDRYPEFFWAEVQPYIGGALRFLEQTVDGKQWVAQLYNHIFQVQHRTSYLGPFPGPGVA